MDMMTQLLTQLLNFFRQNPHILTVMVVIVAGAFLISVVKKVAKWVLIIWLVGLIVSAYLGYDVWSQNKLVNSLQQTFHTQNVKIENVNGDTVKAVVDGVTKVVKVTDGNINQALNSK